MYQGIRILCTRGKSSNVNLFARTIPLHFRGFASGMPNIKPWTKKDIPDLTGKLAIVTGATGGLGFETALALAGAKATLIVAGRNADKGKVAVNKVRLLVPESKVSFEMVDLGSLDSVKQFCTRINDRNEAVDILVNNAGIMSPLTRLTTSDGFEIQFGTNHLAHFALTAQLMPAFKRSAEPRVVNVSSLTARQGKINFDDLQSEKKYDPWLSYYQTKLANLLFSLELQRRSDEEDWGVMALSAHPGWARTNLVDNGPGTSRFGMRVLKFMAPFLGQDAARGAEPQIYAATSPDAKAGGYYGPNGFGEMKGAVTAVALPPNALDAEVAKKLWDVSVELTGVTWE